ncbi:MAG: DUF21 domain-containing protein [Pirellulales bacterium]
MTLSVWIIIACMVGLNALLAAYEIALASITLGRLKVLLDEHRHGAKAAMHMKENMEASLAVVQLGITLVGAIAAATGGAGAEETISPYIQEYFGISPRWSDFVALTLFVIPLSAITIVGGELIPKVFALKNKEWVCLKLSPAMHLLSLVTYPAVWVLEYSSTTILDLAERRWRPQVDGHKHEVAEMQELRAVVALVLHFAIDRQTRRANHSRCGSLVGPANVGSDDSAGGSRYARSRPHDGRESVDRPHGYAHPVSGLRTHGRPAKHLRLCEFQRHRLRVAAESRFAVAARHRPFAAVARRRTHAVARSRINDSRAHAHRAHSR